MGTYENKERIGNFTSSEIFKLTAEGKVKGTFGKPALTYIDEKNMERRLGRPVDCETNAKALTWGKFIEYRCFDLLGIDYKFCSQDTISHPEIDFWKGSPDAQKFDEGLTLIDIKSPITLTSFCQLVDPIYDGLTGIEAINKVRETHKDGDKYYWQIVSNAILTGSKYGELIVYMPYQSEIEDIKIAVKNYDGDNNSLMWIYYANENELPYLIDGGYYKNLNIIRFEIPESDKILLTSKVIEAGKLLKQPKF